MFTINNKKLPPEVFYKKAVLENLSMFTGKHLGWSLFLIKLHAFRSATLLERNFNNVHRNFSLIYLKTAKISLYVIVMSCTSFIVNHTL